MLHHHSWSGFEVSELGLLGLHRSPECTCPTSVVRVYGYFLFLFSMTGYRCNSNRQPGVNSYCDHYHYYMRNKMTPAGLEPAIPGSVGRCLIHWATGPDVLPIKCDFAAWPRNAYTCEQQINSAFHLSNPSPPLVRSYCGTACIFQDVSIAHLRMADALLNWRRATSLSKWRIARQVKGSSFQKEMRRSNPRSKPPLIDASHHPDPSGYRQGTDLLMPQSLTQAAKVHSESVP